MRKYILSILVATAATSGALHAQTIAGNAFDFSQMNYGSTARFKAMGGAQIGVGGDIGSISSNPAGLGLFTKSEFSLTPEFNSVSNKSTFLGNTTTGDKSQINLNNVGVVFYSPAYKAKGADVSNGLVSTVFGLSYNRNNDFLNNFQYGGTNTNTSIRDFYVEDAERNGIDGGVGGEAYRSYLINRDVPGSPTKFSAEPYSANPAFDQNFAETRLGSTSEFNVAGALNFSNKLYIGATASFVNVKYISDMVFRESGILNFYDEDADAFGGDESYSMIQSMNQETKGSGFNMKLGLIFRPVNELRIGINFQTPTWMNVEENTFAQVNNTLIDYQSDNEPINFYSSYNLRTPSKASGGISYIIGGRALISADVDYIDYSSIRFSANDNSNISEINSSNALIKNSYKETVNYRVGAEVKVNDAFSVRAGYGVNGNGIKDEFLGNSKAEIYSGGLGYRFDNYYFDLTYQNYQIKSLNSSPYILNDYSEPIAETKNNRNNVFLTFGVRF
ncbi:OmpP1/FadL family transporter [Pedobacter endophyticus]|uniref:Outer membrane protein transport protein n=1 Tax=Pedobacter endophyticus TaxID=2789740 RepID=A0A7S9L0Y7_9SPHI|nr:outer membrane protein transport protein [Pedobacter endophyticus]QPH40151.1 outer membrane protein transport protein [Pedobacter endophyticus]